MNRRRRARKVVDLVHFDVQRLGDVVSYKLEAGVVEVFDQVRLSSGEERVSDDDHVALREQPVD